MVIPLRFLLPLVVLVSAWPIRQDPAPAPKPPSDPAAVVKALIADGLAHGRAFAMLESLCAQAPLRLSGSEGNDKAVQWAKALLEAEGFDAVRLEPCKVPHWVRGSVERLRLAGELEKLGDGRSRTPLPILALGGSVATPAAGIRARVLRVQSFDELAKAGETARGRIIFFDRPMDPSLADPFEAYGGAVEQRAYGAIHAARAGGLAAIVRSMTLSIDDFPHTGAMRYEDGVTRVPSAAISTAGAQRLATLLETHPDTELLLELDCKTLPDTDSANVIAELRGREKPDEIVLLGAHLDAWDVGSGAHDDGAGCAQVIEALRLLKSLPTRPRRTVRICLFANEENGLRGGRAYAQLHESEMDKHVLALESDRGGFAPQAFGTDAKGPGFDTLRTYTTLFAGTGGDRLVEGGGGADISVLARFGVPLAEYIPDPQRYFDVHHCARDVIDLVNPRELQLGASLIASFVWCIADAPNTLPRNPVQPR